MLRAFKADSLKENFKDLNKFQIGKLFNAVNEGRINIIETVFEFVRFSLNFLKENFSLSV